MRRKLVGYDVFNQIQKESLSNVISELEAAEELIANVLEVGSAKLHSFNESEVYYSIDDGDFVRATYTYDGEGINLNNIEQIVINEESHSQARKQIVAEMLEAVYKKDELSARQHFQKYLEMMSPKMKFLNGRKTTSEKMVSNLKNNVTEAVKIQGTGSKDIKKSVAAKKGHRQNPDAAKKGWQKRKKNKVAEDRRHNSPLWQAARRRVEQAKKAGNKNARIAGVRNESVYNWLTVSHNVLEYANYLAGDVVSSHLHVEHDDLGNVVSIKLPSSQIRNEAKILSYKNDSLKQDVKVLRDKGAKVVSEAEFQQAIVEIKSLNNMAKNEELEDVMSNLVMNNPTLVYLTEDELASAIADALTASGTKNWDDVTCKFIAEGVLRTAMYLFPERVNKLVHLAQINVDVEGDNYGKVQEGLKNFFNVVDEKMKVESQVFEDLHNVLSEIRRFAIQIDSDEIRKHSVDYLAKVENVLRGKAHPSITLAEEVAAYVSMLFEGNLNMSDWKVVKVPHLTQTGDHPDMFKKAKMGYSPAGDLESDKFAGASSDGKNWNLGDELQNKGWSNVGDDDSYPTLNNPYMPKVDHKWVMKGEKSVNVDNDDAMSQHQSGDTFPNLDNPYMPQSVKFHVNDEDRVDDVEGKSSLKVN